MKLFAIREKTSAGETDVAYLFYDTVSRRFFMELPEETDEWEAPLPFGALVRNGCHHIPSAECGRWVAQRIVPVDRQNLGRILRDNGLKEYDPYKLLLVTDGRCAQDDMYLTAIKEEDLPDGIRSRLEKKVRDVVPLTGNRVLVLFRNGDIRMIDLHVLLSEDVRFQRLWTDSALFERIRVTPLGNGIEWDEQRVIPAEMLFTSGLPVPLTESDLTSFTRNRVADTAQATKLLHCSRQYLGQLVGEGRLHPVRVSARGNDYYMREIEALT